MAKWIICSGSDWYRPSYSSTRQIMEQFYKNNYKVLWINPIPFKSVTVNSRSKRSMMNKIRDKFRTHLKIFKFYKKGFFIYVPVYIPLFRDWTDKVNDRLIKIQIAILKILLGIRTQKAILWIAGSFTLRCELEGHYFRKIYEAADLISAFRTEDKLLKEKLKENEALLCRKVDQVFCCSNEIAKNLTPLTDKRIDLLYHGVNFSHFNRPVKPSDKMLEIRGKGLPVAGYFGSLSDINDLRVFEILAKNNFSVVIIGKVLGDYSSLQKLPNVYMLGPIDYKQIPSFGQSFDVCLMNWHIAEWIENCYPVKTLEYLAMGKPVVSVPIPILKDLFPGLIYFASTPEEFLFQAEKALAENCFALMKMRVEAVRDQDWSDRFNIITGRMKNEQVYSG